MCSDKHDYYFHCGHTTVSWVYCDNIECEVPLVYTTRRPGFCNPCGGLEVFKMELRKKRATLALATIKHDKKDLNADYGGHNASSGTGVTSSIRNEPC